MKSDKKRAFKACEELKPQQPFGCEDFDDERNAENTFFAGFIISF